MNQDEVTCPESLVHRRVELARRGANPTVICRMLSGWAVLGDQQFLPGYSLLLPDPVVNSINDLDPSSRVQFLLDMTSIGDALLAALSPSRVNYEILGNTDHALHAHIVPRYAHEPRDMQSKPVFCYPYLRQASRPIDADRDRPLIDRLSRHIEGVVSQSATARFGIFA